MYVQSVLKYFLTQGDSILIAAFASLQDQGIYAVASNYGSLVARVIFQPVEESSRNLFAKLCASDTPIQSSESSERPENRSSDGHSAPDIKLGSNDDKEASANIRQAQIILTTVLRLYCLMGLICCSIGPAAAPPLLRLIAGEKWAATGAGDVLGSYTYYIPLLAINGVSEAFVAAVADTAQLRAQSLAMSIYSVVFGGAVYFFLQLAKSGASGLIWANCINMTCRILYNGRFIRQYFGARGQVCIVRCSYKTAIDADAEQAIDFLAILPTAGSMAGSTLAWGVLQVANSSLRLTGSTTVDSLMLIATVTLGLGASILLSERHFLLRCYADFVRQDSKRD